MVVQSVSSEACQKWMSQEMVKKDQTDDTTTPTPTTPTTPNTPTQKQRRGGGPPRWRSSRFCLAYMVATGLMMVFYLRVSFSMAVICMVNHTALTTRRPHHHPPGSLDFNTSLYSGAVAGESSSSNNSKSNNSSNSSSSSSGGDGGSLLYGAPNDTGGRGAAPTPSLHHQDQCLQSADPEEEEQQEETYNEDGPFAWDKSVQGWLLGALYWGYMASQIAGSYVIQRKGARLVVGVSIAMMSVFHGLCHPATYLSPWAVFALRVVIGMFTGLAVPGMYSVWGRWAPVPERTRLLSMAFAGQMLANSSVFPFSALLCSHGFWGGWPAIFYVFGLLGLVWCIVWFLVVSDTPENHPRISESEKDYILNTRSAVGLHKEKVAVPWRQILRAPCFWAITVSQFTYNWGFILMLTNLPFFLKEAMNFHIQSNGVYSMLPYILLFITMTSAGFMSDFLVSRRLLSVLGARRFFTAIGYLTPAVLLVAMSHQDCRQVAVVVSLLVGAVGVTGLANTAGFYVNPYDIAPRFATNILTATNTMAMSSGILCPYVVAYVTRDETREQWQVVFYITAAIFTFGTVFFCVFARGDLQPWGITPTVQETIIEVEDNNVEKHKPGSV